MKFGSLSHPNVLYIQQPVRDEKLYRQSPKAGMLHKVIYLSLTLPVIH